MVTVVDFESPAPHHCGFESYQQLNITGSYPFRVQNVGGSTGVPACVWNNAWKVAIWPSHCWCNTTNFFNKFGGQCEHIIYLLILFYAQIYFKDSRQLFVNACTKFVFSIPISKKMFGHSNKLKKSDDLVPKTWRLCNKEQKFRVLLQKENSGHFLKNKSFCR